MFHANDLSTPLATTTSDQDGGWTVPIAEPGNYKVRYSAPGAYVTEWFNDREDAASSDNAIVDHDHVSYACRYYYYYWLQCMNVPVNPNGSVESYVTPADLHVVSGRVTDTDENPIAGAGVVLHEVDDLWTTYAVTDGDGRYQVEARGGGRSLPVESHHPEQRLRRRVVRRRDVAQPVEEDPRR